MVDCVLSDSSSSLSSSSSMQSPCSIGLDTSNDLDDEATEVTSDAAHWPVNILNNYKIRSHLIIIQSKWSD